MKKHILYILLFLIAPLTLSAQSSEREKLINNLTQIGLSEHFPSFWEAIKGIDKKENKPAGYNNLAYEMAMYRIFCESVETTATKVYKEFSDEELKEVNTVITSEAYQRINAKELQYSAIIKIAAATIANAFGEAFGERNILYKSDFKIKNKEYTALYDEYYNNIMPSKETLVESVKNKIASRYNSSNKNIGKVIDKIGIFDLIQPILRQTTYEYVSLEHLKEIVAFYKTPTGTKLLKASNTFVTYIHNNSTDGTSTSGIMSILGTNEKEIKDKIYNYMKNYTVEDLKKYIEIRKKITFF